MHVDIPYKSYGWKPPYTDKVIKYDSVKKHIMNMIEIYSRQEVQKVFKYLL